MGAGQSNESAQNGPAIATKTSYYDLLSVDRQAGEADIRKAYRRKALELHPDRNYGRVDETTALFAEVQTAYDVLSDPQERSWYDSHESAILRGDDVDVPGGRGAGAEYDLHDTKFASGDDVVHLLGRFSGKVNFTDEATGFFGYLNDTFARLALEEEAAVVRQSADPGEIPDYPSFGHKDDSHDDGVKAFYAAWSGFATRKTFAWRDKYKLSEAPDRRYKRLMEKENKKLRDEGIREFNDAVRSLIAFVRKRDPRYKASTQSELERQQTLREAAAAQAARARAANEAALRQHVPDWTQNDQFGPDEYQGTLGESDSESEEQTHFECVACHKTFKSENQWDAHERSKKHQKAVKALQKQMRRDDVNFELDEEEPPSGVTGPFPGVEAGELTQEGEDVVPVDDPALASLSLQEQVIESDAMSSEHDQQSTALDIHQELEKSDRQRSQIEPEPPEDATALHTSENEQDKSKGATTTKMGKAAQKRAKKAAAAAAANDDEDSKKAECATCKATFPSRTRLFQHIKDHGHTALKAATTQGQKSRKGKS